MAVDWCEVLGWTEEQLQDLRATGYSYLTQGIYGEAIVFFEALVALKPQSEYDLQTLGALYLLKQECTRAIELFDRALELNPIHLSTQINKTRALLLAGRQEEGLKLAHSLVTAGDKHIANAAQALVMAYE